MAARTRGSGPPAAPGLSRLRSRLRHFAAVGVLVTAVDVVVLLALRIGAGLPVLIADTIAILAAGFVSFAANRALTFTRDPHLRFVDEPLAYGAIALVAGAVDVVVLRAAVTALDSTTVRGLLVAKAVSLSFAGIVRVVGYRRLLFRHVRAVIGLHEFARPAPPGDRRLSVVIPAWRAEATIGSTVSSLRAALLPALGPDALEIVVVDDGSPDATAAAARAAGADNVLALSPNRGKGAAVRAGMLAARGLHRSRSPMPTSPTSPPCCSACSNRSRRVGMSSSAAAATWRRSRSCGPGASARSRAAYST